MDTLSRDSNSSGSILPLVGVIAGGLALVLSILALVKISKFDAKLLAQEEAMNSKIAAAEASASSAAAAAAKADTGLTGLRTGVQQALDQVSTEMGTINGKIARLEEAQKARAAAPTKAGTGGGAAAAPTGVLNADGTYTVGSGDTLSKIARKFAVRTDSIEAENPGLDPAKLRVGQKIRIPKR